MGPLPATPRDQWRRVQLARYLIDYRGVRVDRCRSTRKAASRLRPVAAELEDVVTRASVPHLRLAGKFRDDVRPATVLNGDSAADAHRQLPVPAEQEGPAEDPAGS